MNKQIYRVIGVTEKDYLRWCEENNKPSYKQETKREFFERIREDRLAKDKFTGKLIRKNRKHK